MEKSNIQQSKRHIEVFSAGCATCNDTEKLVRDIAGDSHEVHIQDMQKAEVAHQAKGLGIRSLPAVVIDGKLAGCCAGRGPNEATIRAEIARTRRTK